MCGDTELLDTELLAAAVGLINLSERVHYGPPLGGGKASFEYERIALVTLAELCDGGSVSFDGLENAARRRRRRLRALPASGTPR